MTKARKGCAFFVEYWWKGHEEAPRTFWTREYERLPGMYRFKEGFAPKISFPAGGDEAEMTAESFEPEPIDRKLQDAVIKQYREPLWLEGSIPIIFSSTQKRPDEEEEAALRNILRVLDSFR